MKKFNHFYWHQKTDAGKFEGGYLMRRHENGPNAMVGLAGTAVTWAILLGFDDFFIRLGKMPLLQSWCFHCAKSKSFRCKKTYGANVSGFETAR